MFTSLNKKSTNAHGTNRSCCHPISQLALPQRILGEFTPLYPLPVTEEIRQKLLLFASALYRPFVFRVFTVFTPPTALWINRLWKSTILQSSVFYYLWWY